MATVSVKMRRRLGKWGAPDPTRHTEATSFKIGSTLSGLMQLQGLKGRYFTSPRRIRQNSAAKAPYSPARLSKGRWPMQCPPLRAAWPPARPSLYLRTARPAVTPPGSAASRRAAARGSPIPGCRASAGRPRAGRAPPAPCRRPAGTCRNASAPSAWP